MEDQGHWAQPSPLFQAAFTSVWPMSVPKGFKVQHHLHLSPGRSAEEVSWAGCGRLLNLNLLGVLPLPLQSPGPSVHVEQREGAGGRRAGPLTLNAEAELLLLVGDVAGDSADQGHGQSAGHAGNGAGLC